MGGEGGRSRRVGEGEGRSVSCRPTAGGAPRSGQEVAPYTGACWAVAAAAAAAQVIWVACTTICLPSGCR